MSIQPGLMEVVSVGSPFPGLLRVTFAGDCLRGFPARCAAGHIKLFFPNSPEQVPQLPFKDALGQKVWPAERPVTRTYSVRAFDAASHQLSVDFVLHEAPGHASNWARAARPGLRIGVAGPAIPPVFRQPADWNLFVGDLSALPMICALVEDLPSSAMAEVLVELPTHRPVTLQARCRVNVEQRLGERGESLPSMVRRVAFPPPHTSMRVCVAGESAVTVAIRTYLERELALPRAVLYSVPYWKHATTEEEYHRERHEQMDSMEAS